MLIPCPACEHEVSPEAPTCPNCGHPLASSSPATIDPSPAAAPSSVPVHAYAKPPNVTASAPAVPDFEPAPRERFWRRMGRYALNTVLLFAAQLTSNALIPLTGIGQYVSAMTQDSLQSLVGMSVWWLWVCKTRPAVRATKARYVPGAKEAAALLLAQALLAWLPRLLGNQGYLLRMSGGTGPIIDTVIWLTLAACVMLGRPAMRDLAAFHSWFRMLIVTTRYLFEMSAMGFGVWIPVSLLIAVAGTNLGLLLLLGGAPGRIKRYTAIGIFVASEITAIAMALTTPDPTQIGP